MDMRKYGGSRFLKVKDLRDAPKQKRIAAVVEGEYDKANIVFEDGNRLSLNVTNTETLSDIYGFDSEAWIGHVIELYVGKIRYQGKDQDAVLVRAVSKPEHYGEQPTEPEKKKPDKPPGLRGEMDDEIPF